MGRDDRIGIAAQQIRRPEPPAEVVPARLELGCQPAIEYERPGTQRGLERRARAQSARQPSLMSRFVASSACAGAQVTSYFAATTWLREVKSRRPPVAP